MGYTFSFTQGTPRGHQKVKRYTRKMLHKLPAHQKKEEEEKRYERR